MGSESALTLQAIKDLSGEILRESSSQGLPTGFSDLDQALFTGGIPRGNLSLFVGTPGLGATSVWLETMRRLPPSGRSSLWISEKTELYAPALLSRGFDLKSLYVVRSTTSLRDRQFVLREALEANVFTLIGCEIESLRPLQRSLPQLKSLVRKSKCGFVFISSDPLDLKRTHEFGFVAELQVDRLLVSKSKNRPEFSLEWRGSYAHLLPELSSSLPALTGRGFSELHTSDRESPPRGPAVRGGVANPVALPELTAASRKGA